MVQPNPRSSTYLDTSILLVYRVCLPTTVGMGVHDQGATLVAIVSDLLILAHGEVMTVAVAILAVVMVIARGAVGGGEAADHRGQGSHDGNESKSRLHFLDGVPGLESREWF